MAQWKRWQDWANVVLGVTLFISPFIFDGSTPAAPRTALVIGILVVLVGFWLLANPHALGFEWVQVALGILLFLAPWVLGFASFTSTAWSAWIIGALVVVLAGWVLLSERGPTGQQHPHMG